MRRINLWGPVLRLKISCWVAVLAGFALTGPLACMYATESADSELNTIYRGLIKEYANNASFIEDLRNLERAWLTYRDARASLEAWIAGKEQPDETVRRTMVDQLTASQVQELKQIAVSGSPFTTSELSQNVDWGSKASTLYNFYRQQIVERFRRLTAPWILAEQARMQYLGAVTLFVQKHSSGDTSQLSLLVGDHLAELHWNELNQLAQQIGLNLFTPETISPNSVTDWRDDLTVLSAKQDLRVEFTDYERPVAVANADGSRQELANVNPGDTSKVNTYSSDVFISPDSHWILQITWRAHANRPARQWDAFLYEVTELTPLRLRAVPGRNSFGDLAKKHFTVGADSYADINFVKWKQDKLIYAYTVRPDVEPHVGNDGVDWQCEFDLKTGAFTKPVRTPGPSHFTAGDR
jgi:uncharacterized protein YecT (DUF1311 family)